MHLYRHLLAERRASPALQVGTWTPVAAPDGVLAFDRAHGVDRRRVLVNFTERPAACAARGVVVAATDRAGEGERWAGLLAPQRAVILRPA